MSTSSATRGDGWLRLEWLRHGRNSGCSATPRGLITTLSGDASTEKNGFGFEASRTATGDSTHVAFEAVEGHLSILADLDEVAVGIAHVTTPFPAVIVQRLG
jgi:hypothetical protein